MKLQEINKLLEKYYNAETDLAEEQHLKQFFSSEVVPDELEASKDQFIFFSRLKKERPAAANLENKIMANLVDDSPKITIQKKKAAPIIGRILTAVAAAILLVFVAKSFEETFSNGVSPNNLASSINAIACTNVEQGYEYTHEALQLLSAALLSDNTKLNSFLKSGVFDEKQSFSVVMDSKIIRDINSQPDVNTEFTQLTKGISSIEIYTGAADEKSKISNYFNEFTKMPTSQFLNQSKDGGFSFLVAKSEDNSPHYVFFHSTESSELLVKVSGEIQLSDLQNYASGAKQSIINNQ